MPFYQTCRLGKQLERQRGRRRRQQGHAEHHGGRVGHPWEPDLERYTPVSEGEPSVCSFR